MFFKKQIVIARVPPRKTALLSDALSYLNPPVIAKERARRRTDKAASRFLLILYIVIKVRLFTASALVKSSPSHARACLICETAFNVVLYSNCDISLRWVWPSAHDVFDVFFFFFPFIHRTAALPSLQTNPSSTIHSWLVEACEIFMKFFFLYNYV